MKTNASKILGIFLAALMIVGCMTTFATAISAAGETSVTFLDESGNTIAAIPFSGTATISGLLSGDTTEAETVNAAMIRTETKVFAGWTLTDGTAVDNSTEITESTTVKATYSAYKLYTHEDILSFYNSGNLVISKFSYDNSVTNVFRIRSSGTVSHVINWAIAFDKPGDADSSPTIDETKLIDNAAATREYEVFVAKYKTNQSNTSTGNTSWIQIYDENGATVSTAGYNGTGNKEKRIEYTLSPTGVNADGTGIDDITAVYDLSMVKNDTKISGFRFAPWAGATITNNASSPAATDYKAAYVEIEHFALFEKASAVQYFDYGTESEEEEDDNTVDLTDCHVFEADEITASAAGFFADGVTTVDGIKYYRFTGPEEEYEYTRDYYNVLNVPEDVPAHKYHYAVVGYRTNITDTASVSVGLLPTGAAEYKRFWGLYSDLNGANGALVVDLSAITAGDTDLVDFDTSIDENSNVKYLRVGPHKTYGSTHVANEYLDVEYIGFFKNKASADAYAESRIPEVVPELDMDIDSPYHIFMANQLAGKMNGHVDNGIINENNSQYLSYSGPVGGATYTGSEYVQFSFPKQIHAHTYRYVAVGYKSNIELPSGVMSAASVGVNIGGVSDRPTGFTGELIPSEENEKMIVALTGVAKLDNADYESPINYFRLALYGGRSQFDVAQMNEDDYFDVEYIGFFKTKEAAEAYVFDYEAELKNLEKNYGDANGDGETTTLDSVILMRQLAGWTGYETLPKPKNLDVNLDGEVSALDATIMVRHLAKWTGYKIMPYLHDYNDYIEYREPLKNSYTKLTQDKKLSVAYLGGSITLGRSYESNCWRTMFDAWLKEDYPTAEIKMIHAGIGGTGSSYGAYRVDEVLKEDPDLVFIEFAVNDNHFDSNKYGDFTLTAETVQEFYEAIIQQIYAHDPKTDIVMVYTESAGPKYPMDRYGTSTAAQEELAEYYNINSVYFGNALINYIADNELTTTDYIYDHLHPTDKGYEIMIKPLREMFVNNWGDIDETGLSDKVLPERTMSAHDRKDAYMVLRDDLTYDASVWTKSEFGVKSTAPGATLSFSFTGDEVAVYTSVSKTAGVIEFRIDGGEWIEKSLCGPVVSERVPLISGLDYEEHTCEIKVSESLTSGHTVNLRAILIN